MTTDQYNNQPSSFENPSKTNSALSSNINLLEEVKSTLASNFFVRYLRIGIIYTLEYILLLFSLVTLIAGLYYVTYFVGKMDSLSNNFPSASKDFFELQVIISNAETLAYLGIFTIAALLFIISRFFRTARQRAAKLMKASDHLNQVILNLKAL